jgi:hypothetical protein
VTAYLGALDPRVSVIATACYLTSFDELLTSTGAQDAEQTLPGFVAQGLDMADWVDLCAPRPYAIISTTEDMFPFAGARKVYEEAKHIYSLYGAGDRIQWITGPGGHGNLGPVAPAIIAFLVKHLKGESQPFGFQPYRPAHPDELTVTRTGQISTSIGGETVESINRREAIKLLVRETPAESPAALVSLSDRVRADVRSVAAITAHASPPPEVTVLASEMKDGYQVEKLIFHSEAGIDLAALCLVPERSGPKPAVLMLDERPQDRQAASADVQRLAKSGRVVLLLQSRGIPGEEVPTPAPQMSILGPNTAIALQAIAVGKSLVGMRVDDAIRAVNWLVTQTDVDPEAITLYGRGAQGMVALHAAALDVRLAHVVVESTLISYRMALEAPLHRNLSDIILPGVLLHYDVPDLLQAISPRPVAIVNPADALGIAARDQTVSRELAAAFDADRQLGTPQRIRVIRRGNNDPLPID